MIYYAFCPNPLKKKKKKTFSRKLFTLNFLQANFFLLGIQIIKVSKPININFRHRAFSNRTSIM